MFRIRKVTLAVLIITITLLTLLFYAQKEAKNVRRDPRVLMDRYYLLQHTNPAAAKAALTIILRQNAHYHPALTELSQVTLKEQHGASSLPFYTSNALIKEQAVQDEVMNSACSMSEAQRNPETVVQLSQSTLRSIQTTHPVIPPPCSSLPCLLNRFYALKQQDKQAAWQLIQQIIELYPENSTALKEGAFLAINLGYRNEAISYLSRAYRLNAQAELAMQLAYLYTESGAPTNQTTNEYLAYHYFNVAAHSKDRQLKNRAQNALTNLAGTQTKRLPAPYFSELFFDPLSQSRFGLTVRPLIARLGIEAHNRWHSKAYLVFRQTEDNKSINAGQLPQIYEDNARIIGVGAQVTPMPSIPIIAFIEAGKAYDLIYRNRNRWRNDLRGGLMYYNERGASPGYFDSLQFSMNYYATIYGDITYFSRYSNNIIGTLKTQQGIRLAQYHSSMLNLYVSGRIIEDTNRDFFNNIAEIGPGIGFIPSNRYSVELRFEHINGMYLPVGHSNNPYGKYYENNTVFLYLYTKL